MEEKLMNKVILMGRLTRDPDVRYSQGEKPLAVARYTLAVNRNMKRGAEEKTDFINCVAFGVAGEFAEKYFRKGLKIVITGRIQTGNYTNKDGRTVYTTDVIVKEQEFAESKSKSEESTAKQNNVDADGFMHFPDGIDEELPFT